VRCDKDGAAGGAASDVTVEVTGPWYGEASLAGDQPLLTAAVRRFPSVTKRACLTVPDTVETSDWGSPRSDRCPLSIFRAIREGRLAAVTDNVAAVLGRQPISFDQWAQQNADAFR
jgi:hypothetical protein